MLALITGASSGMGRDMARILSKMGYDLILVARRRERLLELKKELDTNVTVISMDLSIVQNNYKLYEKVKNKNIDILINNAGFGLFGEFVKTEIETELKMIDLNVVAYHILTKLFLQDFVRKDKGYILNVCSSAGFMAGPRMATYYATKNYITKLTMAINEELRVSKSHVVVSALCPGPVATEFNQVAHGTFAIREASSYEVAKYAIDKLMKKKMIIIPTFFMKLTLFFNRFAPYRLSLYIAYKIQMRKSR
ncbi:MAG TPA: SDR family oxidoreductase [Candidatus Caccenecus avistercoris]|nr:SDR family oxidoreductase [Candidatus Caccenecus avistercoris]